MPKTRFVLDECVIKSALEGCVASLEAIFRIVERCDTIVYDRQWCGKCYACIARHAHSSVGLYLLRLFNQCFVVKDKLCQRTEPIPALADESAIHSKDIWLVRLAVASDAIIVTKDVPLSEALRAKSVPFVAPEDAIQP